MMFQVILQKPLACVRFLCYPVHAESLSCDSCVAALFYHLALCFLSLPVTFLLYQNSPAFPAAIAVYDETQLLLAPFPYRHIAQRYTPAVMYVDMASAYRTPLLLRDSLALEQEHGFLSVLTYCV